MFYVKINICKYTISAITSSAEKVEGINFNPQPTSIKSIQKFVGMINYLYIYSMFSRIVAKYSRTSSLLNILKTVKQTTWPNICSESWSKDFSTLANLHY